MFISQKRAKGNLYIYLFEYSNTGTYNTQSLYGFGRKEIALNNMRKWRKDFSLFPKELIEFGCTRKDLNEWIKTLETGVTKTGKIVKHII